MLSRNFYGLFLQMRGFRSRCDSQCSDSIVPRYTQRLVMQNVVHEVTHFKHVGVGECRQEMISQILQGAVSAQKYGGRLLERSDEDGSLGTDDFGADVVAVSGLLVRLNIANGAARELQIHHAGHDVAVLSNFRAN